MENSDLWARVRSEFELDREYIHLALPILAAHPAPVRNAIETHRKGLDSNPMIYHLQREQFHHQALESAAKYLNTEPGLIALTESSTMGFGIIYSGLKLEKGDEVLISHHDHYSAHEALRFRSMRTPISIKKIQLYSQPELFSPTEALQNLLKNISYQTRVIALTWVHSGTGVKLPIQLITQAIEKVNQDRPADRKIITVVDGVHGFGVDPIQIHQMSCDFFVTSCHKWLFGPRGTGLIWGKKESWNKLSPVIPSYDSEAFLPWVRGSLAEEKDCPPARFCTPGGFQSFENRWALASAFDFHQSIGPSCIQLRIQSLAEYCKEKIKKIPGVHLHTPKSPEYSAGFVSFDVVGKPPHEVIQFFREHRIVISQTPYLQSLSRFALSIVNTFEEVDRAVDCLKLCSQVSNS